VTPFYKPIYWFYRLAGGLWRWSRRRFTPAGLFVAWGLLVTAVVSTDIENTVTYQSFTLLLALLLPALATSRFFRAKFSAERILPRFGTAGQPLRYHVLVRNLTAKTQNGLTLLEDVAEARPDFQQWLAFQLAETRRVRPFSLTQRRRRNPFRMATAKDAVVPPLPAGSEEEAEVELLPLRRGILRFSGVTLARPDPLGLVRSSRFPRRSPF
jgi:uncharacterized protein (DUF58 family)